MITLIFICADCGQRAGACPECVNTIAIDPETCLPPDVEIVNGKAVKKIPSEDALQRAEQQPVCDMCIVVSIMSAGGSSALMTAEDRHRLFHNVYADGGC